MSRLCQAKQLLGEAKVGDPMTVPYFTRNVLRQSLSRAQEGQIQILARKRKEWERFPRCGQLNESVLENGKPSLGHKAER